MDRMVEPRVQADFWSRVVTMAQVGWAMLFHSRLKLLGTLSGVVFAVLLSNFSLGTFFGLMTKSTMLTRHANADIWIVPKGAELVGQGFVGLDTLSAARVTPGVERAAPLIVGATSLTVPGGRTEGVTLIGAKYPYDLGGPWNIVAGDVSALRHPDTMFLESASRESFGGLNIGSVREVGGRRTVVGGLTWGLAPFGAPYACADFETAREYLHIPNDRASLVLVRVDFGANAETVAADLRSRISTADIYTEEAFKRTTYRQVLTRTPIGVTFGAISFFGLLVGVIVVGLAMFTSVVDNIREFGMLKAIGCTTGDLTMLLLAQSITAGGLGSALGLSVVALLSILMHSPNVGIVLPWQLTVLTLIAMVVMCISASLLALSRIRKVEPGMVFR